MRGHKLSRTQTCAVRGCTRWLNGMIDVVDTQSTQAHKVCDMCDELKKTCVNLLGALNNRGKNTYNCKCTEQNLLTKIPVTCIYKISTNYLLLEIINKRRAHKYHAFNKYSTELFAAENN